MAGLESGQDRIFSIGAISRTKMFFAATQFALGVRKTRLGPERLAGNAIGQANCWQFLHARIEVSELINGFDLATKRKIVRIWVVVEPPRAWLSSPHPGTFGSRCKPLFSVIL